jgi:hypothetical protein
MKPTVYLAVPIRGSKGEAATIDDMDANCKIAKKNMDVLSLIFPEISWVCVAPYDAVVQKLYKKGYINVDQILECDYEIVSDAQNVLCHLWDSSWGAISEYNKCVENGGMACLIHGPSEIWECDWKRIKEFVKEVMKKNTIDIDLTGNSTTNRG